MWNGVGVHRRPAAIALIVWQALRLANIDLEIGVTPAMITAALAVLTLIFMFIRWIDKPGGGIVAEAYDRTIWAWLGLALAIVLVVGAFLNMQASGEGIADIRASDGRRHGRGEGCGRPRRQAGRCRSSSAAGGTACPAGATSCPTGDTSCPTGADTGRHRG